VRTADFDFELHDNLIAQRPAPQREGSRLLVLHRASGQLEHRKFPDLLEFLVKGDVLVVNNSRVIPARLRGVNAQSGGQFEVLLLEETAPNDWWAMIRPGKRARIGSQISLRDRLGNPTQIIATVLETNEEGHRRLRFEGVPNILEALDSLGETPLPPYITRDAAGPGAEDIDRYQTVFAKPPGSVAAPTAGLHFTKALLEAARLRGVTVCHVTLHVGLGTFAPVKTENLEEHPMHEERYEIPAETAEIINRAKAEGRRVIAVGTTSMRVLETSAQRHGGLLVAGSERTRIFIYPPFTFQIVSSLLTNFHLPRSTLLMLISAFAAPGKICGRELVLNAYAEAIREHYRFFSYGDAMVIL
jgi:S-adenosylmethionine:tRNA ribosyltransferase-isomerase